MALIITLDVNDEHGRQRILEHVVPRALASLHPEARPAWGRMSAQQMVEHLTWAFECSTGAAQVDCPVPAERRERMKSFLYDDQPSPREFMNPVLRAGLPPLRHPDLAAALAALDGARRAFLEPPESDGPTAFTHPIFGPIGREEWSRVHCKHVLHHLEQFGLVATA